MMKASTPAGMARANSSNLMQRRRYEIASDKGEEQQDSCRLKGERIQNEKHPPAPQDGNYVDLASEGSISWMHPETKAVERSFRSGMPMNSVRK